MSVLIRRNEAKSPIYNPGFVYVLKAEHGGVKVGASVDPPAREKSINAGKAINARVVFTRHFDNYCAAEQRAHFALAKWLLAREWFSCPVERAIAAIEAIDGSAL